MSKSSSRNPFGVYAEKIRAIRQKDLQSWSDEHLRTESRRLRAEARSGTSLDDLLVDAYALVSEAAYRTLNMQPYDVQLMAAIALHEGGLIEQQTGEGKTLSAVMPAYLNALTGEGVHILTFNDYLADRDARWMGPVYAFLGLTVASVQTKQSLAEKREAYGRDVTYVTAKEAGFDYLRDTIAFGLTDIMHRPFRYVIVDEADSLLLDEARVPLVVTGEWDLPHEDGGGFAGLVKELEEGKHYDFDEFGRNVYLNEAGAVYAEERLNCGNLYDSRNMSALTSLNCALHAELLLHKDVDYIVRGGKIELIEEYTGRIAENRYLPDGLHAALTAKEGLKPSTGGKILGTITLQHLISLYPKICGMTATAKVSEAEFETIYSLRVVKIPPNRPNIRVDLPYRIYTHQAAKLESLVEEIASVHATGRPILIGTASVEESDDLARALSAVDVSCQVLNAKNDAEEANIIAEAGRLGAVTVSTNMAGRGVDIRLGGGHPAQARTVADLGGLYVIGTRINESTRIDDQLRGRSGRQGDPGSSVFYISLEDERLVRFGIKELVRIEKRDECLDHPSLQDKIAHIQRVMAGQNFDIHRELNAYSDMVEDQRRILHRERLRILNGEFQASPAEQRVRLFYIDEFWSDHLAYTAYLRESIHLEGLVNRNPIDAFHLQITEAYERLATGIEKASVEMLARLEGSNDPAVWEAFGLKSPASTRTYMINDQYIQNARSSWTGTTIFAYWIRKMFNPLFDAISDRLNPMSGGR